jgi:type IV pilus assembly protein PilW
MRALHTRIAALKQTGFSLVELMIAMTLGLVTIGAVGWVYLGTSQTYRSQDALARLQEGARYAFEVIGNDVRMTGANACYSSSQANVINGFDTRWYTNLFDMPLSAEEFDGGSGSDTEFSDALRVVRADVSREYIVNSHTAPTFTLTSSHDLEAGALMVATDCNNVAMFQASAAAGTQVSHGTAGSPGNSISNLGSGGSAISMPQGSRLYRVSASSYFIDTNPAGEPALYRSRPVGVNATPTAEELVEGVEDLQVAFAVDSDNNGEADFFDPDGDGDPYLTGDQVSAAGALGATPAERWERVESVRISLLIRTSEDNVIPSAQTLTYNGAPLAPGDRRLRRVFTHVIKVRNR